MRTRSTRPAGFDRAADATRPRLLWRLLALAVASAVVLATAAAVPAPAGAPAATGTSTEPSSVSPAAPASSAPSAPSALAVPAEPAVLPEGVVDLPVEFTVDNVDRSRARCSADGEGYTVRGHLTAPASVLDDEAPAVMLLVHGTNTGEWIWRLDVQGRNFVHELAARGYASVTIDRLGYGSSDIPDGFASCSGAHSDIAHQVVEQLRAGDYELDSGHSRAPRSPVSFDTVFAGGHSSGALVAETAAVSFGGVDGLFLTGWAAVGVTTDTNRRFLTAYETCLGGGEPHTEPGDPTGYVRFDATIEDFLEGGLGPSADPAVTAAVEELWGPNPCGVMVSEPMAILYDLDLIGEIDVPVHLVFGSLDVLRQGVEGYPGLFTSSPAVTHTTLGDAGHFVTVDEGSERVYDEAAEWMERHTRTP